MHNTTKLPLMEKEPEVETSQQTKTELQLIEETLNRLLDKSETISAPPQRDTPRTRTKAEIRAERLSWALWAAGVYREEIAPVSTPATNFSKP